MRFGLIGDPDPMHEVRTMLFAANVDAPGKIKDALKPAHPAIRSQHSCEAIAAGLGFRTYNGLRAALDAAVADWDPVPNVPGTVCCHIDGGAFRERIQTLAGIDVPSGAFLEAILRACPAMACGENVHERLLVAIAEGLAANYFRRLLGSRYVPISAAFEFVRFAHDPDCPVSWNNGVATNVLFHNTGNRLFPAFKLPSGEDGFRFLFHDRDTVLPLYWREIAAMSHLAREAEQAIAGDLARLPGCGRLFEMTWARPIVIDAEAACCEVKLRAK
jgi:hypothetical protein